MQFLTKNEEGDWRLSNNIYPLNEVHGEIIRFDKKEKDLVIFKIPQNKFPRRVLKNCPSIHAINSNLINRGDTCYLRGFPHMRSKGKVPIPNRDIELKCIVNEVEKNRLQLGLAEGVDIVLDITGSIADKTKAMSGSGLVVTVGRNNYFAGVFKQTEASYKTLHIQSLNEVDSLLSDKNDDFAFYDPIQEYKNDILEKPPSSILLKLLEKSSEYRYRDGEINTINNIDISFDEIYYPLKEAKLVWEPPKEEGVAVSTDDYAGNNSQRQREEIFFSTEKVGPINLEDALQIRKQIVVLGGSGSGKYTLLQHFLRDKAKKNNDQIPVYVDLVTLQGELDHEDKNISLGEIIIQKKAGGKVPLIRALKREIEAGNILWLLDSFDQINQSNENDDFWNSKLKELPGSLILVSRPYGFKMGSISFYHYKLEGVKEF